MPPVLLGSLGNDPHKNTICLYGHLDVQPADISDGWDSEPFILSERNGKLYGRGSTDDKGPVLGWLHAIEAFQNTNVDIPVNLKVKKHKQLTVMLYGVYTIFIGVLSAGHTLRHSTI